MDNLSVVREQKKIIDFSQYDSLDIRMCKILECHDVCKNTKLEKSETNPVKAYKLLIDTGIDKRQCITNLISFDKDSLVGLILPFIINLPVATIRGVESSAMILASSNANFVNLIRADPAVTPGDIVI